MDGGVYSGNLYVCTDHFEMPTVYDGITLPESEPEPWYAFRLLVAKAPEGNEPTVDSAEWITLPMTRKEMIQAAEKLGVSSLTNCVYYDFESSVPQITDEDFTSMQDINMLNEIAKRMAEMSPEEQITFKAALEAEKPHGISLDDIENISNNLYQYEMSTVCDTPEAFFKEYLLTHMNTKFDERWLDSLHCRSEGNHLLSRLGASVTEYGIISSWGGSLYKLVPYENDQTEQSETSAENQTEDSGMVMRM